RDEIRATVGAERPLALADRSRLPYTAATLCELQRVANIVPTMPHATVEAVEING
ncbi:MAG: cytochrome P450, partial [Desulfobacteraceae bacterium]|nr:cytochrome P450 [Desulfobacteraceae bacterium]